LTFYQPIWYADPWLYVLSRGDLVTRKQPHHQSESSRLRRLAKDKDVEILFSDHAEDELLKDRIYRPDTRRALEAGSICRSEMHGAQWRRTVKGHDVDGGEIMLVVVVSYELKQIVVITGWRSC